MAAGSQDTTKEFDLKEWAAEFELTPDTLAVLADKGFNSRKTLSKLTPEMITKDFFNSVSMAQHLMLVDAVESLVPSRVPPAEPAGNLLISGNNATQLDPSASNDGPQKNTPQPISEDVLNSALAAKLVTPSADLREKLTKDERLSASDLMTVYNMLPTGLDPDINKLDSDMNTMVIRDTVRGQLRDLHQTIHSVGGARPKTAYSSPGAKGGCQQTTYSSQGAKGGCQQTVPDDPTAQTRQQGSTLRSEDVPRAAMQLFTKEHRVSSTKYEFLKGFSQELDELKLRAAFSETQIRNSKTLVKISSDNQQDLKEISAEFVKLVGTVTSQNINKVNDDVKGDIQQTLRDMGVPVLVRQDETRLQLTGDETVVTNIMRNLRDAAAMRERQLGVPPPPRKTDSSSSRPATASAYWDHHFNQPRHSPSSWPQEEDDDDKPVKFSTDYRWRGDYSTGKNKPSGSNFKLFNRPNHQDSRPQEEDDDDEPVKFSSDYRRKGDDSTGKTKADSSSQSVKSPAIASDDKTEDDCVICMSTPTKPKQLRCGHQFCTSCIDQNAKQNGKKCPVCGEIYGKIVGTQPKGGTMTHHRLHSALPGHPGCGTISISYSIPGGIQGPEHPHPSRAYPGLRRTAYLPDSPEGSDILKLLRRAFEARLIFTVGRSTTSGADDQVTWNDIHHKTSIHGGPSGFGYPDPTYLQRVRDELKAKGIQ